jgi:hypothetical protein
MDVAQSAATVSSGEDLDVVLGRFQNWAKTQRSKLGKSVSSGPKLPPECREISYEQAMQASSFRRPANPVPGIDSINPANPTDTVNQKDLADRNVSPLRADARQISRMDQSIEAEGGADLPIGSTEDPDTQLAGLRFARAAQTISDALGLKSATEVVSVAVDNDLIEAFPVNRAKRSEADPPASGDTLTPPHVEGSGAAQFAQSALEDSDVATGVNFHDALQLALISSNSQQTTLSISHESETVRAQAPYTRRTLTAEAAVAGVYPTAGLHLRERAQCSKPSGIDGSGSETSLAESIYLRQSVLGLDEPKDQVEVALARLYRQHSQGELPVPRNFPAMGKFVRRLTGYFVPRPYRRAPDTSLVVVGERTDLPHPLSQQISSPSALAEPCRYSG